MSISLKRRHLVQDEPIEPWLAHRFDKLDEVDRFPAITVATQAVVLEEILIFFRLGEHDYENKFGPFIFLSAARECLVIGIIPQ
jgi:hypothetical protein